MSAEVKKLIAQEMRSKSLPDLEVWADLDALSSNTIFETTEVFEDEIRIDGTRFEGPINVYVTLNYGKGDDGVSSSEVFPGKFVGHMEERKPLIDDIWIDLSSFSS